MDAEMHVLGSTFSATISDNSGSFDLGSRELLTPFAVLTSNGYFRIGFKGVSIALAYTMERIGV